MPAVTNSSTVSLQGGISGTYPDGAYVASFFSGTAGTATANGASNVTVANTKVTANTQVLFTLKTVGGTVGAVPSVKTITPGVGFAFAGTASDTSVYNYMLLEPMPVQA